MAVLDALGDPDALDPSTAQGIHAVAEALKLAFADREAWYGDGYDVPLETLLSQEYAAAVPPWWATRASREVRPGRPDGREPRIAAYVMDRAGRPGHAMTEDATTGEPDGGVQRRHPR